MSWKDEIRREKEKLKMKQEKAAKDSQNATNKVREFWEKLLQANSELEPDLRLPVGRAKCGYVWPHGHQIHGEADFIGNIHILFLLIDSIRYGFPYIDPTFQGIWEQRDFRISCDSKKKLYGCGFDRRYCDPEKTDKFVDYNIDDRSIQILLRNMHYGITNHSIVEGLSKKWW